MDRDTWQRLSRHLDEALALSGADREAWLARLDRDDPDLAPRVRAAVLDVTGTAVPASAPPQALAAFGRALAPALTSDPDDDPLAPGQRLGAWELIDRIGQGGMGQVWRARRADGLYEAEAAIKLLRSDLMTPGMAARFAQERAVLARLEHPLIARLLDAGVAQGQAFLVLELVRGQPMSTWVRERVPTVADRVRLLRQVAEAVEHAHGRLIVHRDLKPGNVLVDEQGRPRLLDFGIAALIDAEDGQGGNGDLTRLTGRGLTLAYAAPEQVTGGAVGVATDVFSLGVMLYELLGGRRPFGHAGLARVAAEHALLHTEAPGLRELSRTPGPTAVDAEGPGVPRDPASAFGDLEAVAAKALRKDPGERYRSVSELMADLDRWLSHRPVSVRREHWRHNTRLWLRRHRLLAVSVGGVGVALSLGLAAATWQWQRAERSARESALATDYLGSVLASASPDRHGGQWPTVLEVLEAGLKELPERTRDEPGLRVRLMGVMADTYIALDRFDRALPLLRQWYEAAERLHGPQSPQALKARLMRGRAHQVLQDNDDALAMLEPLRETLPRAFGPHSPEALQMHKSLAAAYMHSGRFEPAERELQAARALVQQAPVDRALEEAAAINNLQVLRFRQGRLQESLDLLRSTEPFWSSPDPRHARTIINLRRNLIDTEIDISQYRDIEPRSRALQADMDRLFGPGSEVSLLQSRVLARYLGHTGQYRRSVDEYQAMLERARKAGIAGTTLLRARADTLLMRARAGEDRATVMAEARALQREIEAQPAPRPSTAFDAVMALAELGLLYDDEAFASAMRQLHQPLREGTHTASRWDRIEGQFARLRGDLATSRERLARRVAFLGTELEKRTMRMWSAQTDLAYTLVLAGDPGAAAAVARARAVRPPDMPPGQPLDAIAHWLEARLAAGNDDAPAMRAARQAVLQVQGRDRVPARALGLGSMGGAVF
ncbi:MAG: serine/threonine protein kinase [Rubrivivax sp.]|nr:serine/threonine protein kinase [Rubrivivax sp.]